MNFHWIKINTTTYHLIGYEDHIIAILNYDEICEMWSLTSSWLNMSENTDFAINYDLSNINIVKEKAIEQLIVACDDQIDWYKGQISMLKDMIGGE